MTPVLCDPLHETSRSGGAVTIKTLACAGRLLLLQQSRSLPLANLNVTFVCSATFWMWISHSCGALMRIQSQIWLCTQIRMSASVHSCAVFC